MAFDLTLLGSHCFWWLSSDGLIAVSVHESCWAYAGHMRCPLLPHTVHCIALPPTCLIPPPSPPPLPASSSRWRASREGCAAHFRFCECTRYSTWCLCITAARPTFGAHWAVLNKGTLAMTLAQGLCSSCQVHLMSGQGCCAGVSSVT